MTSDSCRRRVSAVARQPTIIINVFPSERQRPEGRISSRLQRNGQAVAALLYRRQIEQNYDHREHLDRTELHTVGMLTATLQHPHRKVSLNAYFCDRSEGSGTWHRRLPPY